MNLNPRNLTSFGALGAGVVLCLAPCFAFAQRSFTIRDGDVVPVIVDSGLDMRENCVGDHFTAHVERDPDFPDGTRFVGRVRGVHSAYRDKPGYMDLEFTEIELPDGDNQRIHALPVPLTDKYVVRDRDGRFRANNDTRKQENQVLGGALGGLVIGSLIKKPVEGAIIGAVAGVLIAKNDKSNDGRTVLYRDQKIGAMFDRTVTIDLRRDYRRQDDRYNRRDDGLAGWPYPRGDRTTPRYQPDRRDDYRGDAPRSGDLVIRYRDQDLRFDPNEEPVRDGREVLVPLKSAADQLGLSVDDSSDKTIYVEGSDSSLRFERNSSEYRINGHRFTLDAPIAERHGVVYVPIEMLAALRSDSVYVNGRAVEVPEG